MVDSVDIRGLAATVVVTISDDDQRELMRRRALARMIFDTRQRVRHLDYQEAEIAAETLASRLLDALGSDRISSCQFHAIPRGGLIVLGMLSYLLRLRPDQVNSPPSPGGEHVIVDDIALTGARVRRWLDDHRAGDVHVAHLASHPELRVRIAHDVRVSSCHAAIDLRSEMDSLSGAQLDAAQEFSRAHVGNDRYWLGRVELLTFSWCEPDRLLWQPTEAKFEGGWHLVSPERCLKNRATLGPPSIDRTARGFRFPESIAYGHFDGQILVCRIEQMDILQLDPVAAEMWGALATLGDVQAAALHLGHEYDVAFDVLVRDLSTLAERLLKLGLLLSSEE